MSFFKLPLWLLGLNNSTGTDKLLAVKDNGEVTKSNKTLDEIGLTPNLQDVTTEGNTTTQAIQVFNNVTANNFISATGQAQAKILKAQGDLPLIQINDTDVGGSNIELRPHAGTYDIDITTPTEDGQLALNTTSDTKTITGTGDKIVLSMPSTGSQSIIFNSGGDTVKIENIVNFLQSYLSFNIAGNELLKLDAGNFDIKTNSLSRNGVAVSLIYVMSDNTPQTTALLNSSFPDVTIGTKVVNLDTTERYTYTKVSSSLWRQSALMTDI